ncbi:hypothetical protein GALMADRAFT_56136 [Galerina marginata CBS 339.88]|uniref:Uncharacterized protein n=1 Tax=Galerina marginata (strain CBS 339.88) TaxID=685588 RepID=A0A067TLV8_GALM3|nr:hypothetical protein GALMADRAFT_56136 [Galerina marginata CBS 339.88]
MRNRTASTLITLFGAVTNSVLTIQILAAWRSIKWETESEWELSRDKWQLTGIKIIWGLCSVYFASATAVCIVGLHGVLKHKPSLVRFYRDYSIADFSFCAFFTALATYAAFLRPARAGLCEEFSHHPELMRDMLEIGLNLENCELWIERAVFAGLAVMFVIMVIRLHFLLTVSNYYSHLARHYPHHQRTPSCSSSPSSSFSLPMQRIFVLPKSTMDPDLENGVDLVYAAVPRHTLPKEMQEQVTEAWVPSAASSMRLPHHRRHHRHHRHRSSSRETTGLIKLDISPDEGLLPYADRDSKA